jgi:HlyD family secretion protein
MKGVRAMSLTWGRSAKAWAGLAAFVAAGVGLWLYAERSRAETPTSSGYRTAKIERGSITSAVTATGTINPTSTVIVGSQMSGLVKEILVDFNSKVSSGQVVARLDDTQARAKLEGARADLAQAQAQIATQQAQALKNRADADKARAQVADAEAQRARLALVIADAQKTYDRQAELSRRGVASAVQLQSAKTALDTQEAQIASAQAQIGSARAAVASLEADAKVIAAQTLAAEATARQRAAVVKQIEVDLSNTEIRSPVDGVVVQRQIELGQTVAASLQTPTLFLIAQNLATMEIYANVDESDVGRVKPGQRVVFTVNAYPARTFEGRLKLVRLGSQTVQNVVIYTAIVAVENPRLELLPGMTASLRIVADERENVLKIPNAALRWRPAQAAPPAASAPQNPLSGGLAGGPGLGPPRGGRGAGAAGGGAGGAQGGGQTMMRDVAQAIRDEVKPDSDQQAKIDRIIAGAPSRFQAAAGEGAGADPRARREKMREARAAMMSEIEATLRPDQKPAFEAAARRVASGASGRGGEAEGAAGRVFVLDGEGEPQAVAVRLGASDGSFTEALSGLDEGREAIVGGGPPKSSGSIFGRFF